MFYVPVKSNVRVSVQNITVRFEDAVNGRSSNTGLEVCIDR